MEENLPEFGILSFTGLDLKLLFFGGQIYLNNDNINININMITLVN